MAHKELKKQYEEDRKNYEKPWKLWEFRISSYRDWFLCDEKPIWIDDVEYRRKEPRSSLNTSPV